MILARERVQNACSRWMAPPLGKYYAFLQLNSRTAKRGRTLIHEWLGATNDCAFTYYLFLVRYEKIVCADFFLCVTSRLFTPNFSCTVQENGFPFFLEQLLPATIVLSRLRWQRLQWKPPNYALFYSISCPGGRDFNTTALSTRFSWWCSNICSVDWI